MNLQFLVLLLLLFCGCCCSIDPEQTYRVYNVTDSSGKTYNNLRHICGQEYRDQQGRWYAFNGNYTVISSTISGHEILRLRAEKE